MPFKKIGKGNGYTPSSCSLKTILGPNHHQAERSATQVHCLFEYGVEHGGEVAGRGVDDLEDLGSGDLLGETIITLDRPLSQLPLCFVPFGSAFGKLTLQIGYELFGMG